MPKLGMVMAEGILTRWTRGAGETVERGEVIAEIETEKVNYDLEATTAGVLHPVVEPGTEVEVEGLLHVASCHFRQELFEDNFV